MSALSRPHCWMPVPRLAKMSRRISQRMPCLPRRSSPSRYHLCLPFSTVDSRSLSPPPGQTLYSVTPTVPCMRDSDLAVDTLTRDPGTSLGVTSHDSFSPGFSHFHSRGPGFSPFPSQRFPNYSWCSSHLPRVAPSPNVIPMPPSLPSPPNLVYCCLSLVS